MMSSHLVLGLPVLHLAYVSLHLALAGASQLAFRDVYCSWS